MHSSSLRFEKSVTKKKKIKCINSLDFEAAPTNTEDIDISCKVSQDYQIFNTNRVVSKVTQTFHFFQEFSLRPYMSGTAGDPQIITLNRPGTALVLPLESGDNSQSPALPASGTNRFTKTVRSQ